MTQRRFMGLTLITRAGETRRDYLDLGLEDVLADLIDYASELERIRDRSRRGRQVIA